MEECGLGRKYFPKAVQKGIGSEWYEHRQRIPKGPFRPLFL